jgi:hypothetical protein
MKWNAALGLMNMLDLRIDMQLGFLLFCLADPIEQVWIIFSGCVFNVVFNAVFTVIFRIPKLWAVLQLKKLPFRPLVT